VVFTESERTNTVMDVGTVSKTRPFFPQPRPAKRVRDKGFLKFVGMGGCAYCGKEPVQVHHIRKYGWGSMGRKPDDYYAIALCPEHHDMAHNDPAKLGKKLGIEEITETIFRNVHLYVELIGGDLEGFHRHMAEAAVSWMKEER
jgi:hypothetical protein